MSVSDWQGNNTIMNKITESFRPIVETTYARNASNFSRGSLLKALYEQAEAKMGELSKDDKVIIRTMLDQVSNAAVSASISQRIKDGTIHGQKDSIRSTPQGVVTSCSLRVVDNRKYSPRESIGLLLTGEVSPYARMLKLKDEAKQISARRKVRNDIIVFWQECLDDKTAAQSTADLIVSKFPELSASGLFAEWLIKPETVAQAPIEAVK